MSLSTCVPPEKLVQLLRDVELGQHLGVVAVVAAEHLEHVVMLTS
jgi:hypothetical protein